MHISKIIIDGACKFSSFKALNERGINAPDGLWAFGESFNYNYEQQLPIKCPDFRYFYTNVNLSDIEDNEFRLRMGFFASIRFVEYLNTLNHAPFKPFQIFYIKRGKIFDDYYYLLFYKGYRHIIDFYKSTFYIVDLYSDEIIENEIMFESAESLIAKKIDIFTKFNHVIKYKNIKFIEKTVDKFDFFPLYLLNEDFYVSDKFVEGFKIQKFTGVFKFERENCFCT